MRKHCTWRAVKLVAAAGMILLAQPLLAGTSAAAQDPSQDRALTEIRSVMDAPGMERGTPVGAGGASGQTADAGRTFVQAAESGKTPVYTAGGSGNVPVPGTSLGTGGTVPVPGMTSGNASPGTAGETVVRDEQGQEIGRVNGDIQRNTYSTYSSGTVQTSSTKKDRKDEDEDTSNGPGASTGKLKVEDSGEQKGPQVQEVTLRETYHADFLVYTESIEDRFFLYSNIGNNGMTDKPVYVDIPQNISYTVEKDGVPFSYTSKQQVGENGTYVFWFTVVKNPEAPLSEQVIYKTTFNFRIQPRPELPDQNSGESGTGSQGGYPAGGSGDRYGYGSGLGSYGYDSGLAGGAGGSGGQGSGVTETMGQGESALGDMDLQPGDGSYDSENQNGGTGQNSSGNEAGQGDGTGSKTGSGDNTPGGVGQNPDPSGNGDPVQGAGISGESGGDGSLSGDSVQAGAKAGLGIPGYETGFVENYDPRTGMFQILLSDARFFHSSVPNGMLWHMAVTMDFAGMGTDGENIRIVKDGEVFAMPEDSIFRETGSYTFQIPSESGPVVYGFQIMGQAESGPDMYTVPAGMTVQSLTLDGEPVDTYDPATGRVDLSRDGDYVLTLDHRSGASFETLFTLDREAPEFTVTLDSSGAVISYISADVAEVHVTRNGETSVHDTVSRITAPGSYEIQVFDWAGNSSSQTFTVRQKTNLAGILAIAMVVALVTAGVVYFRKTKKNFDVK